MTAQPIGYDRRERPPGQPGEVAYTQLRKVREWCTADGWPAATSLSDWPCEPGRYVTRSVAFGMTYPAVLEPSGTLWIWRDSETSAAGWIRGTGWIEHFEPGPEWQANCQHQHVLPWQVCGTEAECTALAKGEPHD